MIAYTGAWNTPTKASQSSLRISHSPHMAIAPTALPRSPYSPLHRPPTNAQAVPSNTPSRAGTLPPLTDPKTPGSKVSPLSKLHTIQESTSSRGSVTEISPEIKADPEPASGATGLALPQWQISSDQNDMSASTESKCPSADTAAVLPHALEQATSAAHVSQSDETDDTDAGHASAASSIAGQELASPGDSASEVPTEAAMGSPVDDLVAAVASLVSEASDDAQTVADIESMVSLDSDSGLHQTGEPGPINRQAGQSPHLCVL